LYILHYDTTIGIHSQSLYIIFVKLFYTIFYYDRFLFRSILSKRMGVPESTPMNTFSQKQKKYKFLLHSAPYINHFNNPLCYNISALR